MRFLITLARAYPHRSALTLLAMVLAGLVEGIGMMLLLPIVGSAMGEASGGESASLFGVEHIFTNALSAVGITPTVGTLLVAFVACIFVKSALLLVAKTQVGYTVAHVATEWRLTLLRALLAARWEHYVRQPVGSLANAVGTEAIRAASAYLQAATLAALLIQAGAYAIVAALVAWKTTLISAAACALLLFSLNRFVAKAGRAGTRQTQLLKSLLTRLTDSLQSIKALKAMAREDLVGPLLQSFNARLNRALRKQVLSMEALSSAQEAMLTTIIALGLYIAIVQLSLPFSTVVVLVFLLARLFSQLAKVQRAYQKMQTFESAYWSLQAAIDAANNEREAEPGGLSPRLEQSICLERVMFAYETKHVLQKASLSIPVGSFTAIVGRSGEGKTTIVDLITGLLRPQQGQILIDDIPLEQIDLRKWRLMIGYVPQEALLLHDTILYNVTLGDSAHNEADAEAALRAAGAWDFVAAMPQGILSSVGERGTGLSGGQRQRIAMARALVQQPKLLILDEVTSALDRESEAAICDTLRQLRGDLTILVISHQPAMVDAADRVYRVQNGTPTLVGDSSESALLSEELQDGRSVAGP